MAKNKHKFTMSKADAKGEEVDIKRFNVPFVLNWKCPKCGEKHALDYWKDHHLSFPVLSEPFKETLWCSECDEETDVKLLLTFNLELV